MPTLYVTRFRSVVRRRAGSLLVTRDEDSDGRDGAEPERRDILLEVEPHRLELIAFVGSVHVTRDALDLCLEKGIDVAWFSRNGRLRGRLVGPLSRTADLRLAQWDAVRDPERRLRLARTVVGAKLSNASEVLEDLQGNRPDVKTFSRAMRDLRAAAARAKRAEGIEQLLGIEGAGARAYFEGLVVGFSAEIRFERRQRRPPPDPANSLLSFGYTLLANLLAGRIEARGLDPCVGFFHEARSGRPSLALDLLEELRHPVVDRLVLRLCNLRILKPEDFEPDHRRPGGVVLRRDSSRRFFKEWEAALDRPLRCRGAGDAKTVRDRIDLQIESLATHLRHGDPYAPFEYGD